VEIMALWLAVLAVSVEGQPCTAPPIASVGVQGRYVTVNGRPIFLVGQMTPDVSGRSLEDIGNIVDVMMCPFGLNLWAGNFGLIEWGAWNEVENVRRSVEHEVCGFEYPWKRIGPGETTFGGPRFDLDSLDETYFSTLHARLALLNEKGIVPVVTLFSDHALDHPLHWRGHPFHPENNVNDLGLPSEDAIPEFFENQRGLAYLEQYVRRLMDTLDDVSFILEPFGEARQTPPPFIDHWLRLLSERKQQAARPPLICLSGTAALLDQFAGHPAVDVIDVYCYHGVYDDPRVNVPDGPMGIRATFAEAWRKYRKPVGKLYHKYGYPYANPKSPWADPDTGTDGGGPPTIAKDALYAAYESGGFGYFFKMAWRRDRGQYLTPDAWSNEVAAFMKAINAKAAPNSGATPQVAPIDN